jgi:pseudolysin
MEKTMSKSLYRFSVLPLLLMGLEFVCANSAVAAQAVNLQHKSPAFLQTLFAPAGSGMATTLSGLKEISSQADFKKTLHVRVQQMYIGYPVWGGDAVIHVPAGGNVNGVKSLMATKNSNATLSGTVYQGLAADLGRAPTYIFNAGQANKALEHSIQLYQKKANNKSTPLQPKTSMMVYLDENTKAHWVFLVSFVMKPLQGMIAKPTYIVDAENFKVYQEWDDIHTLDSAQGGGFGGNHKVGKFVYDSLKGDYPQLSEKRDAINKICYLQNTEVTVRDARKLDAVVEYRCDEPNTKHNNIYWDADFDLVNGAYSPSNDALYAGMVVKEMYQKWYGVPVLVHNGQPMMLTMRVHQADTGGGSLDNAYWDGGTMTFGDGGKDFYPFVSIGVTAHEVSHGFTQQHSDLKYFGQCGGLNESFSDMAAQAVEFYLTGHNSWRIGQEIVKAKDRPLRYMDEPTQDCYGSPAGRNCSISNVIDYKPFLNVHLSSGVFNKAFFLLSVSPDWNTRKAFDVMVQANSYYWTPTSTFAQAACGVVQAAKDYKYDVNAVANAMRLVGISVANC